MTLIYQQYNRSGQLKVNVLGGWGISQSKPYLLVTQKEPTPSYNRLEFHRVHLNWLDMVIDLSLLYKTYLHRVYNYSVNCTNLCKPLCI